MLAVMKTCLIKRGERKRREPS